MVEEESFIQIPQITSTSIPGLVSLHHDIQRTPSGPLQINVVSSSRKRIAETELSRSVIEILERLIG